MVLDLHSTLKLMEPLVKSKLKVFEIILLCNNKSYRFTNEKLFETSDLDDTFLSFTLHHEAKVFLNSVDESIHYQQLPLSDANIGRVVSFAVSLQQTKNDKKVRDLSIAQRKCIFSDEVKMKFYKNEPYTFSACMRECQIERALKLCNCLPPFYRPKSLSNVNHCGIKNLAWMKYENISDIKACSHCELPCELSTYSVEHSDDV